jgi:hypothetical protein
MKLVYSVVAPVPRTQVLAPLFNYILTNSEDRRFEASVSDIEPVVCLSVATQPLACWHCHAVAVAAAA